MPVQKTLSFAEIVKGRDSSVPITDDGMVYAVDLAMVVTGANRDDSGKTLRRLPNEVFHSDKMSERQLSSRGGPKTKLVNFEDALLLVMVLPGKTAREIRVQFCDIIRRYMAGDQSLHAKIDANAQSNSPIAQMARASINGKDAETDSMSLTHKRKLEELEITRQEKDIARQENEIEKERMEIEKERMELARQRMELTRQQVEYTTKQMVTIKEGYNDICQDTVIDERARLIFKDYYLNMAMAPSPLTAVSSAGSSQALLTNGSSQAPSPNKPISLSQVAHELGLKIPGNKLIAIGMELKKRYVKRHGKEPAKHDQLCEGRMTKVNSYTEGDRDLVEDVLRSLATSRK